MRHGPAEESEGREVKRTIEGRSVEYDFCLIYRDREAPFASDAILESPITDDSGCTIIFRGTAAVVATETERSGAQAEHRVYISLSECDHVWDVKGKYLTRPRLLVCRKCGQEHTFIP